MRLRNSIWAVFGRKTPDTREAVLERVREAMLLVVDGLEGENLKRLESRINAASEIDDLWHMRPDLMRALAGAHGEEEALNSVVRITALFGQHHLGGRTVR